MLSLDEANAAVEEFTSFVDEKPNLHMGSSQSTGASQSASAIPDFVDYVLRGFSFQERHHLLRVFKICCMAVSNSQKNLHL